MNLLSSICTGHKRSEEVEDLYQWALQTQDRYESNRQSLSHGKDTHEILKQRSLAEELKALSDTAKTVYKGAMSHASSDTFLHASPRASPLKRPQGGPTNNSHNSSGRDEEVVHLAPDAPFNIRFHSDHAALPFRIDRRYRRTVSNLDKWLANMYPETYRPFFKSQSEKEHVQHRDRYFSSPSAEK